jgi:hypothetical protein
MTMQEIRHYKDYISRRLLHDVMKSTYYLGKKTQNIKISSIGQMTDIS